MRSGDHVGLINNAKTNSVFGRQAGGKLIDRVLSFIHDDSVLVFRVHMYCEPGLTPAQPAGSAGVSVVQ